MTHIVVTHRSYGCDTGCCGHVIEVDGKQHGSFHFRHPYGQTDRAFIETLVREEGCDPSSIDWDNCSVLDD